MKTKDVTIILPTKNEATNIIRFLSSLPITAKLVVVDSSNDGTADIVKAHRPEHTRIIRAAVNVTLARQIGSRFAYTPWLLFTDADVVFGEEYFNELERQEEADVFYGPKLSRDQYIFYYRMFSWGQMISQALGIPAASGSNLIIKRLAFENIKGFDTDLNCNEDSEVVWRLSQAGYQVRFCPSLFVFATDHRRIERGILKKTLHTLARCFLLYTKLITPSLKRSDWGYWKGTEGKVKQVFGTSDNL